MVFQMVTEHQWEEMLIGANLLCLDKSMDVDEDGYPLTPNSDFRLVFKTPPSASNIVKRYSNWAQKIKSNRTTRLPNGTTFYYLLKGCQGVIRCSICNADRIRPTTREDETSISKRVCPNCKNYDSLEWISCDATSRYDEMRDVNGHVGVCLYRHSGMHKHNIPINPKPDASSKRKFVDVVAANPTRKPLQL